jgi:hypothetical protein
LTTWQSHLDVLVQQTQSLASYDSCTRASSASPGFADAAFVHSQVDIQFVNDHHEFDIGEFRKSLVVFYRWTEFLDRRVDDVRDPQDTVWIAHGNDANVNILAQYLKLDLGRFEYRSAHADGHEAIRHDARFDVSRRAFEHKLLCTTVTASQNPGNTANAIATLFNFRAIGIEHSVTGPAAIARRLTDPQQLIETGSGCLISEFAEFVGRRRRPV